MVGRLLVGFVCLNLQFSVSWLVDIQWASCVSIFRFLCHGRYTFSGVREAQSFVFCVMVGRLLVGFVLLNLQFSVAWLVDFQWGSCVSIFSFLCHGWQIFSGVRVALQTFNGVRVSQSLVFYDMVGRLLVGFVWLNLQISVSCQVDFQWGSCVSIFSFLCHGRQTFNGVRVAQSLVFCVMVGRLLVGFVWLNLQISVSCQVDFQWGSCVSIFSFLCHGRQTFNGVRVAQSLVFCVMVGRLLVGFLWLNLLFSVSWLVDFQWGSCGSIVRFLCHGWQIFSGVRVAQSLVFCVMVGRLLVGFVWLNLQFSVSWLVDFQWGSCGSNFSFLCHGWQTFSGVRVAQSLVLCHGRKIFRGVRVAQSLVFCVKIFSGVRVAQSLLFCDMVGRLLGGFVWLNLQFSVSWLVDFQWGSCGSIFMVGIFLVSCVVFCVMVGRFLVGFVWLNLQFSVSWLVDFQFSVSWLVDFQWGSCGFFSFLCHGWQTFSGVRVAQSLVFCVMVGRLLVGFVWLNHGRQIFSFLCHGWQSLLLVGFVWLNLQFSVSWLVDFQWGSCGSNFSFLCHGWQIFSGVRVAQSFVFCVMVGRLLLGFVSLNLQFCVMVGGVRVAQSLVFCVMVGRLLVGFVWLNLQFCVMVGKLLVGFVWLNLQFSVSWLVDFQWGSCGSNFSVSWLQTFSGVRVSQSLVFCVMVGRLLVGFVWLYLQFSVQVDFQWGSCGSIQFSVSWLVDFYFQWGLCLNLYFSVSWLVDFQWLVLLLGVRVAQSLVFCVMVGRLLVGFVWLNRQFSVSWLVDFQWGSCGSIFSFLCHGWQTFSGVRVAQSLVFCVMVGRFLVGFVWLNLQFSVSWLVDFQWGSCGSIFSFLCHGWQIFSGVRVALCHGWQTFSGVRVAQSLVFCVMVGRFLVGFVWLNLIVCVMVGRLLVGFVWLYLQFSVSWQVNFQWGSCGSIFSFLCDGWQIFSGVRVAQSLVLCVMVDRLLVGFVWFNLQFSVS